MSGLVPCSYPEPWQFLTPDSCFRFGCAVPTQLPDPGEHTDLKSKFPGVVAALVRKLEAYEAMAMKPCNLPGGTCQAQDPRGLAKAELERAWVPWAED